MKISMRQRLVMQGAGAGRRKRAERRRVGALLLALVPMFMFTSMAPSAAAQAPEPEFMRNFFPPELVMQNQRAISLRKDQRKLITKAIQTTQSATVELQWEIQAAAGELGEAVSATTIDEKSAIEIAERMMDVEGRLKRAHLRLLIQIRNALDADQRAKLQTLRE